MRIAVGSMISARGREWVVLPGSTDDLILIRPLGGGDAEETGLDTRLETVAPAAFGAPNPTLPGDHHSACLLRDAPRLGFHYLDQEMVFPERVDLKPEPTYRLSAAYKALFEKVLRFARETVRDTRGGRFRQRVRWWSALALLRSLASSPAAAAATLRNRSATADAAGPEEADEIGRHSVFDLVDEDAKDATDVAPGAESEEDADASAGPTRRERGMLPSKVRNTGPTSGMDAAND